MKPEGHTETLHSPTPWRSVYPLGSKQRCAAVEAGDHYVYLYVAEHDATVRTIAMHQANADLIVEAVNSYAALQQANERMRRALEEAVTIIDAYYQGTCCCSEHYACSFCKEADEFIKKYRAALAEAGGEAEQ